MLKVTVPFEVANDCLLRCAQCDSALSDEQWEPYVALDYDGEFQNVAVCFPCLDVTELVWLEDTNEYLAEPFEHMSSDMFADTLS